MSNGLGHWLLEHLVIHSSFGFSGIAAVEAVVIRHSAVLGGIRHSAVFSGGFRL
jgi:hypothetical protein